MLLYLEETNHFPSTYRVFMSYVSRIMRMMFFLSGYIECVTVHRSMYALEYAASIFCQLPCEDSVLNRPWIFFPTKRFLYGKFCSSSLNHCRSGYSQVVFKQYTCTLVNPINLTKQRKGDKEERHRNLKVIDSLFSQKKVCPSHYMFQQKTQKRIE